MSVDSWIQIVIALLAAIAIIVSCIISSKEMKQVSRLSIMEMQQASRLSQLQSQYSFFAEYTKRYQDIILAMPVDVFNGTAKLIDKDKSTIKYMRLYFDLCSEEFHLHGQGLIPNDIWGNWVEGMKNTFRIPLFSTGWKLLGDDYNEDFKRFITHEVLSSQGNEQVS